MQQREMKNWLHRGDTPGRTSQKRIAANANALSALWQKQRAEREEAEKKGAKQ